MKICVPRETHKGEKRIPLIPLHAGQLVKKGAEVIIESGLGKTCGYTDQDYQSAGVIIEKDRKKLISEADVILRLRKPELSEISLMKEGTIHISYLDPFFEKEILKKLKDQGVSAFCMEMIPRSTRAQKMDSLSSQASLAGYVAVVEAMKELDKIFPMMMTPAGTIQPSKVFIIGAGVAGLQAIATAKRMGARVEAFDTRPVVEEQVQSLGAKFVKIDLGETGQTKDGYAKELTPEQLKKQQEVMAKHIAQSDVVVTTANLFGRKAPIIVTKEMVASMKPGSIIVDIAADGGGNVEGTVLDQIAEVNGVKIIGWENFPGMVPVHASQMYSSNLFNLVDEFWNAEQKAFLINLDDDIVKSCLVTHKKEILNDKLKG